MDFFEHQAEAKRNTTKLVFYFAIAVVLIMVGIYFAIMMIYNYGVQETDLPTVWFHPVAFLVCLAVTLVLIGGGSLYKVASLAGGGDRVARMLGGRELTGEGMSLDEKKVLNVVEEMSIASGVPVPPVFVMDGEESINAFAAGTSPSNAVIGVTRGCIEKLGRDELQGVIAHEFSHILHGDMRLNIRLIGILHGILLIGLTGSMLMRMAAYSSVGRSRRDNGAAAFLVLGLAVYILGMIGVFFGSLIKAAVSRQREFLADAAAVQFTRNPDGIGGALKKIGGIKGSKVATPAAEEASHMFFGQALSFSRLFATHPPIEERVARIDPNFERELAEGAALTGAATGGGTQAAGVAGLAGAAGAAGFSAAPAKGESVLEGAGEPSAAQVAYGRAVVAELDEDLHDALHSPYSARAVVYALLLDSDREVRDAQLAALDQHADPAVVTEMHRLRERVAAVPEERRLALFTCVFPALARLTGDQYRGFAEAVDGMIHADRRVDLFEYALRRLLRQRFEPGAERPGKATGADLKVLLSAIAHAGADSADAAGKAFVAGASKLGLEAAPEQCLPPGEWDWERLDAALDRLRRASFAKRRNFLAGCCAAVAHDDEVRPEEGDLVRAIAAALDCPLPPLVVEAGG